MGSNSNDLPRAVKGRKARTYMYMMWKVESEHSRSHNYRVYEKEETLLVVSSRV